MDEQYKKSLGKVIRYLRQNNDLKQDEMADMLDKSANYISLIENGKRTPSLDLLFEISRLFEIGLHYIFMWTEMFYGGNDDG